ncbi:Down syndrome cell adhesion molecule-like protein Dscam2 isoform X3 [Photinus pyralis]|uniref:Down syndrome cell adhesion molecule-like protein Dscam2 isoform X3 n=1 Tax=Photinus pyralis TaxID=7054 RepID=UPI0012672EB0|nr:Down syndrome cell adhesion molecule-like protein Dscam2 isoform X3 [Photinus pyralis]
MRSHTLCISTLLTLLVFVSAEDDTVGPVFVREPPNRIDFSNTTGAVVECSARGHPPPEIIWVRSDGTAVGDVPGLRQVLANGNLVFPPFRAEDYRQEVHAQIYACLAKNSVGSIHSKDVNVRAVVQQFYQTEVNNEYVIRGNAAVLKCAIPSFVADFVIATSWADSEGNTYNMDEKNYVVAQTYEVEADNEYVIRGNSAVMKCEVPSFVSDFVVVENWQDSRGNTYLPGSDYVVNQYFEAQVYDVFVIKGNTAIFKCQIPSFVSDHVDIISWQDSDKNKYLPPDDSQYDSKYLVLPSGELHIRDVGPEDGYKTYQCRTKHRLTGETRLSATKGRLVITEPVGVKTPVFSSDNLINAFARNFGQSFALLCQAQGFPVPRFSQFFLEPIGSKAPAFSTSAKSSTYEMKSGGSFSLLCPAQSLPVPAFRWYKFLEGTTRKQAVQLNDRVKQVAGTLIIREAKVEDSGKYLCVVNNSVGGESVETVLTVTAPLKSSIEPQVQTIDFGRPAVFTCHFEGNPIKTISWLKDGKRLDHHEAILRIEAVRKEDKGMYQCFIRNDQESAEATAELKLGGRFEPPQIRHAFAEETLQPGSHVFLKCIAAGNPTPEIAWELDGRRLSNNDRYQIGQYVTVNGDVVSNLNVSAAITNDGGLYRCIASSKVGSVDHAARINIYGLPFVRSMEKQAIVAGGTLIVHCPVAGYPIDTIVWERDGRVLPINRKQKVFPNGTLIIENVERASDQASYTCVAKNSQGYSARGSLEVQVMVPPQMTSFDFGEESINTGDTVVVTCGATKGDPPTKIVWSFNTQPLQRVTGVSITNTRRTSQLLIESVLAEHAGMYTCRVQNEAGYAEHSAYLHVNGTVAPVRAVDLLFIFAFP